MIERIRAAWAGVNTWLNTCGFTFTSIVGFISLPSMFPTVAAASAI